MVSVWSEMQIICMWYSWCHCNHIISCLTSMKSTGSILAAAVLLGIVRRLQRRWLARPLCPTWLNLTVKLSGAWRCACCMFRCVMYCGLRAASACVTAITPSPATHSSPWTPASPSASLAPVSTRNSRSNDSSPSSDSCSVKFSALRSGFAKLFSFVFHILADITVVRCRPVSGSFGFCASYEVLLSEVMTFLWHRNSCIIIILIIWWFLTCRNIAKLLQGRACLQWRNVSRFTVMT